MGLKLLEVIAAAAVLVPVFLILGKLRFHSREKTVLYLAAAIYFAAVYNLVGLPTVQFLRFDVNLNLIPFRGMIADMKNCILNVLLFVPLGFLLPLLWERFERVTATLRFGLLMTVSVELLQMLTLRATDINDVITNFAGTLVGYGLFRLGEGKLWHRQKGSGGDLWLILGIVAATMFFVQPCIFSFLYAFV